MGLNRFFLFGPNCGGRGGESAASAHWGRSTRCEPPSIFGINVLINLLGGAVKSPTASHARACSTFFGQLLLASAAMWRESEPCTTAASLGQATKSLSRPNTVYLHLALPSPPFLSASSPFANSFPPSKKKQKEMLHKSRCRPEELFSPPSRRESVPRSAPSAKNGPGFKTNTSRRRGRPITLHF